MAELCDDSDIYSSGGSGEESIISATSDQWSSHGSRLSTTTETFNEEVDDLESTDSSIYLEPHTNEQDSDEAFNLNVAADSDSDVDPVDDEEEEEEDINVPSPGDFASLLKESHFRLICEESNTVFIEAMVLIFQFGLK